MTFQRKLYDDDPSGLQLAQCSGKEALTWAVAKIILSRERGRAKHRSAYRCRICLAWHIGSPPLKRHS